MAIKELLRKTITKSYFNKTVFLFSLLNALLLCYLAWKKNTECSLCHQVPFLSMTDVNLAVTGIIVSLALAIMVMFSCKVKLLNFSALFTRKHYQVKLLNCSALFLAFIAASLSSFLLTSQVLINKALCYPCLLSSIIFYLIFFLLFYEIVLKPIWSKRLYRM